MSQQVNGSNKREDSKAPIESQTRVSLVEVMPDGKFRRRKPAELYSHLILETLEMIADMGVTQSSLANVFHVHRMAVSHALAGRSWKLLRKIHAHLSKRRAAMREREGI